MGIQGAVFRYQMTAYGTSLIPITYELQYVLMNLYNGNAAVSVVLWALGTLVLTSTTILAFIFWNCISYRQLRFIVMGIASTCVLYLVSCIIHYGLFFSGPAGISLPLGIIILSLFAGFLFFYQNIWVTGTESG